MHCSYSVRIEYSSCFFSKSHTTCSAGLTGSNGGPSPHTLSSSSQRTPPVAEPDGTGRSVAHTSFQFGFPRSIVKLTSLPFVLQVIVIDCGVDASGLFGYWSAASGDPSP